MLEFNLNTCVHVKYTQAGIDVLRSSHERLQSQYPGAIEDFIEPTVDADGYTTKSEPLWSVLKTFGPYLHFGDSIKQLPFSLVFRAADGNFKEVQYAQS